MKSLDDPRFPGLRLALDPCGIAELLGRSLPECREQYALESVKVYSVHYRPGTSCLILYTLRLRDRSTSRSARQLLSAELLPAGAVPLPLPAALVARYAASAHGPLRTPTIHLREAGWVGHPFPLDPALPSLVDACDPRTLKARLNEMWKRRGVRVRRVIAERIGYTPRARAALGYEVLGEERGRGLPELRHLVGKIDAQRGAPDLFARNWAVWRAASERIHLAPPVGFAADLRLYLQERVEGRRLAELAGTPEFQRGVRRTAMAVGALHAATMPLRSTRDPRAVAEGVHRWGGVLAAIRPANARRVRELRDRLAAELERRATVTGAIHGDLHPSNVLVHDGRVTLIDLDNMVAGDRLLDVGRFLSALRTSAIRVSGQPDGLADAGAAFLERYLGDTGEDESRVRLFEAAALITSAATGFRLQRPGWEEHADRLVADAERLLDLAGRRRTTAPRIEVAAQTLDRESWAADPHYVRALLHPCVRRHFDADLTVCRVGRRRVTARSAKIRYHLGGTRRDGGDWRRSVEGILGRDRARRGAARRLAAVEQALAPLPDALGLPRSVGFIRELGLHVVDPPCGVALAELSRGEARETVQQLAHALAALHRLPVTLNKSRSPRLEIAEARRRFERSAVHPTPRAAAELLRRLEHAMAAARSLHCPVLRRVAPSHVLRTRDGVALGDVEDIVHGHPCWDAADFLARLAGLARREPADGRWRELAREFRAAFVAADPASSPELDLFESTALLRLACAGGGRADSAELIETAARRLDGVELSESTEVGA